MENMNHIHLATGNGEPPASRILPSFNSSAPVNNNSGGGGGTEAMNVDIARVKNELYDAETAFPVKVEQSPEALAEPPSATSLEQLFDQTINLSSDEEDIDDVVPAGQGDEGIEIDISERMQRIKRSPLAHRISMTEAIPDSGNINMSRPKLNTVKSEPSTFTTASTNENRQLPPAANETVNVSEDFEEHVSNPAPAAVSNGIQQLAFTPQRRKVQPQDFHCNLTEDDQELIIVLEENNRNLVRVYAKTDDDVWYCHLCRQKSKKNRGFLGYMNADNTFDALINHECEPITYEESNRVQIYAETSSCANERNDGNRKRKIRIPSVSNDFYRADDYKFKKESVRTREQPRK
uniref:Uncharacterized protein n=1 Tax=Panagrolaimus sp. ES5 TaxID=591445 RepID=A0AC34FWL6_9BILA